MRIDYKELTIRDAGAEDAAQLAVWWNDGEVMAHAGFPLGLGTTAGEVAADIAGDTDDTRRRLIIECAGSAVGEASYRNLGGGTAEIGIKLCEKEYRERGLGRVLLSMLIKELFGRGYGKIILDTNKNNTRAQHVYELLGFRKLRVNENAWQDQLGIWQSSVDYELTPESFRDFSV